MAASVVQHDTSSGGAIVRSNTRVLGMLASAALLVGAAVAPASATEDLQPRPGCGFGDANHNHQAAPGRDPAGLRPGRGYGDDVNEHTAPPGLIPAGEGEADNPRRGCIDDPRER
jgi:hypothetical protein